MWAAGLVLLRSTGSVAAGTWTRASGMWDLPRPGTEPVSPVSEGRVLTTEPSGKSKTAILLNLNSFGYFVRLGLSAVFDYLC